MKEKRNRILLVSADCSVKKAISAILDAEGFDILQAETAHRALRTIRDYIVGLVILDDRTPLSRKDTSGGNTKALKAITDASPFLPIVFVCGTVDDLDHAKLLS
ncbi:MAG TPA: hypothetical protein VN673_04355 [Clostridia bacterium]|nr:hypothetical protein [Clostridia bacterium]